MGILVIVKDRGVFQAKENLWNGANHRQNLKENLVQSTFHQTLGDTFTFQQDNNLKHKGKSTLELLTKTTLDIPEWPSYSFDLHFLENLWQDLKMSV